MAAGFFAELGNTLGNLIPYECPHCKQTRKISEYGGNIITGAVCPNCGQNPTPPAVAEYIEEHRHEYEGELTEEKQRQLTGMAYKFLGGDGNLPNIQQIITTARVAVEGSTLSSTETDRKTEKREESKEEEEKA